MSRLRVMDGLLQERDGSLQRRARVGHFRGEPVMDGSRQLYCTTSLSFVKSSLPLSPKHRFLLGR